jgi:hypothetical protein
VQDLLLSAFDKFIKRLMSFIDRKENEKALMKKEDFQPPLP